MKTLTMRSAKFKSIEQLIESVGSGTNSLRIQAAPIFNDLFQEICSEKQFSVFSMILYQEYRYKIYGCQEDPIGKKIPNFMVCDILQLRFISDPSDFAIVLALGIQNFQKGDWARAEQLFKRVANSTYKESRLAKNYLENHFIYQ